jgi:hypothetical protein
MRVVAVDEHPTLATGKTDYAAVLRLVNAPIDSAALPIDSAPLGSASGSATLERG